MSYVLINRAEDGTHTSVHKTEVQAKAKLLLMTGPLGESVQIGRTYYSDWGNALTIEERPDGWTTRTEDALRDAFDARECETATKAQLNLLMKHGW